MIATTISPSALKALTKDFKKFLSGNATEDKELGRLLVFLGMPFVGDDAVMPSSVNKTAFMPFIDTMRGILEKKQLEGKGISVSDLLADLVIPENSVYGDRMRAMVEFAHPYALPAARPIKYKDGDMAEYWIREGVTDVHPTLSFPPTLGYHWGVMKDSYQPNFTEYSLHLWEKEIQATDTMWGPTKFYRQLDAPKGENDLYIRLTVQNGLIDTGKKFQGKKIAKRAFLHKIVSMKDINEKEKFEYAPTELPKTIVLGHRSQQKAFLANTIEHATSTMFPDEFGKLLTKHGWAPDNDAFVYGDTFITAKGKEDKYAYEPIQPCGGYPPVERNEDATLATWKEAIWDNVKDTPAGVCIILSMIAPLIKILEIDGFSFIFTAEPSSGKSKALEVMAHSWGIDHERVWGTYAATRNALTGSLDIPIVFDDFTATDSGREMEPLIYAVFNNRAKGIARQNVDRENTDDLDIRTCLFTSGETAVQNTFRNAGTLQRIIYWPVTRKSAEPYRKDTYKALDHMDYPFVKGALGYHWIKALLEEWPENLKIQRSKYHRQAVNFIAAALNENPDDVIARRARIIGFVQSILFVRELAHEKLGMAKDNDKIFAAFLSGWLKSGDILSQDVRALNALHDELTNAGESRDSGSPGRRVKHGHTYWYLGRGNHLSAAQWANKDSVQLSGTVAITKKFFEHVLRSAEIAPEQGENIVREWYRKGIAVGDITFSNATIGGIRMGTHYRLNPDFLNQKE